MTTPKVYDSEYRFCQILWEQEPVKSRELVRLCQEQLGWKATTTYTVIKRLCDKGCLKNEATIVSSLVPRETVQQADGQEVLARSFGGSLPDFLAAFLRSGDLSDQDADAIEKMLEEYRNRR